nr:MAG: ORF1 [TTV-like mini virus]
MPPYWRRRRWRAPQYRRRRWPRLFRPRTTIRGRWRWRRRWRRRWPVRRRFYRRFTKRKLQTIRVKQWQPYTIRKCIVSGLKCLFQGGPNRLNNNYWQYPDSFVPARWQGGGGWGLQVISLESLYEDYEKLQNWWSNSNAGLPLVRYIGTQLTFYQHTTTDYVVTIDTCWPLVDTYLKHPNSQPQRMLMSKRKIIVPSIRTKPLKKRRKRKFVRPPPQMTNQWYFQKDICKTKLLMITATACDLTNYYLHPAATSNNISLIILNTNVIKTRQYQHITVPWQCKQGFYLYSSTNNQMPRNVDETIFLGNFSSYTTGTGGLDPHNWGNPFHSDYLKGTKSVWTSPTSPTANKVPENLQLVSSGLANIVRYNPNRDKGYENQAYFVNNYSHTLQTNIDSDFDAPGTQDKQIDGYPLWIMLFGWPDWIKKAAQVPRVDDDQILTIQSQYFSTKYKYFVPLSESFYNGKGPYNTDQTDTMKTHWYPKFMYQQEAIETLISSGPGCCRTTDKQAVEAHMKYRVLLKWGGCPSTLEKVYDPCLQPKWPTPGNIPSGLQIQNPGTEPSVYFQHWDVRRGTLTEQAHKRLKRLTETDKLVYSATGRRNPEDPPPLKIRKETQETSSDDSEEEKEKRKKAILLRRQLLQSRVKHRLLRLLTLSE